MQDVLRIWIQQGDGVVGSGFCLLKRTNERAYHSTRSHWFVMGLVKKTEWVRVDGGEERLETSHKKRVDFKIRMV